MALRVPHDHFINVRMILKVVQVRTLTLKGDNRFNQNLRAGSVNGKLSEGHREKVATYKPRREASGETNPANTFQAPEL